jgi:cytochrome oxidase Cu insertion factor (SCO1/SenC/PrrC family)
MALPARGPKRGARPTEDAAERPAAPRLVLVSAVAGALIVLAAAALFVVLGRPQQPALPVIGWAPHYRLLDQHGRAVSSQDFAGKVSVVAPMFPYCRELCPLVAANLAEFNDKVVQNSNLKGHVVFVFFNLAPSDAGPPELREFLKQYGWNPDDPAVEFLTGSPDAIKRVVEGGYHIAYYRTEGDDEGPSVIRIENRLADQKKVDFDVKHADIIELVDGKGRIRKIFSDGSRVADMPLAAAIRSLLRRRPAS